MSGLNGSPLAVAYLRRNHRSTAPTPTSQVKLYAWFYMDCADCHANCACGGCGKLSRFQNSLHVLSILTVAPSRHTASPTLSHSSKELRLAPGAMDILLSGPGQQLTFCRGVVAVSGERVEQAWLEA